MRIKKNIVKLYAYLQNNLGDDLMVEILCKRYPDYIFYYVDCWDGVNSLEHCENFITQEDIYRKYGRLNHILNIITLYVKRDWFFKWFFALLEKNVRCATYIGGSIYMEGEGEVISDRISWEKRRMEKSPLYVIGANFGPYIHQEFYQEFYKYFCKCASVVFRDKESFEYFKKIPQVSCAPDVVLNLDGQCEDKKYVVISVINLDKRKKLLTYKELYEDRILSICKKLVAMGKKPVLCSFCQKEGDEWAVERIYTRLNEKEKEATICAFYREKSEEILKYYKKAEYVLATRFHSMILAMCFNVPFFAFSYDIKMQRVLDELNCKNYCKLQNVGQVPLDEVLDWNREPIDVSEYRKNAISQFKPLDQLLFK